MPEEKEKKQEKQQEKSPLEDWQPRTELGKKVKNKEITDIDRVIDSGYRILEPEIVDMLLPDLESDLLLIGQSRGKFGGGQRRVFKQTQKKTGEGNKPHFACYAVIGNKDGYIGVGYGKAKETVPAREKAIRNAKMAIFRIARGSGSWQDGSSEPASVPFRVKGKNGSVSITLFPAPKGQGLVVASECQRILRLAGIKNVWSRTKGRTKTRTNLIRACVAALKQLSTTKLTEGQVRQAAIFYGRLPREEQGIEKPVEEEVS
jgi:small subunit ribosomal protein S5